MHFLLSANVPEDHAEERGHESCGQKDHCHNGNPFHELAVSLRSFCNFNVDLCVPLRDQSFRDVLLRSHSGTKYVDLVKLTMSEGMLSHQCTPQLGCQSQRALVMASLST